MIVQIQYYVDGTGVLEVYNKNQKHILSICNSWSIFQESGAKFVLSETRLHTLNFSETESRRYYMKGKSTGSS